ncbi:hypothetical protein F4819DRAFT_467937 [Hypoxylon fuscum]|nr:hypothetical protein F4819DRAFT_467937 [Hypoxylon fuscum]
MNAIQVRSGPQRTTICYSSLPDQLFKAFHAIMYHIYTMYLFSCNNFKDIVCTGFLFGALNAPVAPRLSMGPAVSFGRLLKVSPLMLLWSWSNLFLFNLHNQRHPAAIAEDATNKPWRPLPAGRLTAQQATRVMYLMYPLTIAVALMVGGLVPCLLEAFCCLWYNEWGGSSDPIIKNLLNGLGFMCFFAGPLEVATGHSAFIGQDKATAWLAILAATITTTSHLQDFRDVNGDKATGRKTVPLAIGDLPARGLCTIGILVWNSVACWFWEAKWKESMMLWAAGIAIIVSLLWDRSTRGDIFTWKLFPLWILGLTLPPVLKG